MRKTNLVGVLLCLAYDVHALPLQQQQQRTQTAFSYASAGTSTMRLQATQGKEPTPKNQDDDIASLFGGTRRDALRKAVVLLGGASAIATTSLSRPSWADVFVDPDRYGDKELKIATVNKVRQNVRDAILQKPSLAPLLLKLAVADALTYEADTGDFGPDGSVLDAILASSDKSSGGVPASLASLRPAAQTLSDISNKLRRTTELTRADVVTLAGAEAIESVGGPRIPVQMGKLDPKTSKQKRTYVDLDRPLDVANAFRRSGLTEREMALLFGMIGVAEKAALSAVPEEEEEEEENEMGDKPVFIPQSFGTASQIYGKTVGGATSVNAVAIFKSKDFLKGSGDLVAAWTNKYGGNNAGFVKDIPEAYDKVMGLGRRYTGGKVGSLLGGSDQTL